MVNIFSQHYMNGNIIRHECSKYQIIILIISIELWLPYGKVSLKKTKIIGVFHSGSWPTHLMICHTLKINKVRLSCDILKLLRIPYNLLGVKILTQCHLFLFLMENRPIGNPPTHLQWKFHILFLFKRLLYKILNWFENSEPLRQKKCVFKKPWQIWFEKCP